MGCHCIRLGWQRTSSVFTFECHGDTHGHSKSRSKRTVMPFNYPSILVLLYVVNKYTWLGRIRISFDISFSLSPYKSWTNHTATTTTIRLAKIISIRIAIGHQKCVYYYSSQVHYLFFTVCRRRVLLSISTTTTETGLIRLLRGTKTRLTVDGFSGDLLLTYRLCKFG